MNNIIVRKAASEDLAYILVHLSDLHNTSLNYIPLREEVLPASWVIGSIPPQFPLSEASVNSLCLVAESGNQIVGVLTCRGGRYAETRHVTVVEVFISPVSGGQDIESRILREAIAWAQGTNIVRRLEIRIPSTHDSIINICKQLGFEVEATCRDAVLIGDRFVDIVIMAFLL
jgi:GNAT superfamily N-acetyltransferase